ncbi:MAG: EAL domain-containing protein [Steroidobacteraceae bacterium]
MNKNGKLAAAYRSVAARWARFNPGLSLRLGVAFAAVVVLALAANTIAERGAQVVRHSFAPPAPAPQPVAAPVALPLPEPLPVAAPVVAPPPAVTPAFQLTAARTLDELEDFRGFRQARTSYSDAHVEAQFRDSRERLQGLMRSLDQQTAAAGNARRKLRAGWSEYLAANDQMLADMDRRRAQLLEYRARVEALIALVRDKLEGGWKIFGRVISRQYLVEWRDDLDQVYMRIGELVLSHQLNAESLAALEGSEQALVARMTAASARLREGDAAWWAKAQEQLAALPQLRSSAQQQLLDSPVAIAKVEALHQSVVAGVNAVSAAAQQALVAASLPPVVAPVEAARHAPTPALSQSIQPADEAAKPAPAASDPQPPLVEQEPAAAHDALLLWLSGGVLLVILLISAGTVRGIARQTRRLQQASQRIAAGEQVTVAAGGIRELDLLASSFNEMSTQLQAARRLSDDHQRELESRVEQRTQALLHQATHDPLTDLPNRRQLYTLLETASAAAARDGALMGVFLLDLDNFKDINDSMGHGFGDQVLVAIAQRLRELTAPWGFAARLGGDEFTAVMTRATDMEAVRTTGWELVRAFQQPLLVEGRELLLSTSVGASIYPDHESTPEELLRAADAALFRAKALGRSQLTVFTAELLDVAAARFSTEQGLRRAVERGEFQLVFQPEISLETFEVKMVEALLRWRLPDGTHASPGEFLAVAEESGLITEISDWVLREAISTASRWHHGEWPEACVAINVSPRQMLDEGFVRQVATLLAEFDLPPRCIEIELTENVLQTGLATIRTLEGLRGLGIAVALDDFGTGYSSLTSVEKLPLSRIKLDRSLIEQLDTNPRSWSIAEATIQLCHGLGLEVTAEGIERVEQLQMLLKHPRLLVQGFLLSRPLPEEQLHAVRRQLPSRAAELLLMLQPGPAQQAEEEFAGVAWRALPG